MIPTKKCEASDFIEGNFDQLVNKDSLFCPSSTANFQLQNSLDFDDNKHFRLVIKTCSSLQSGCIYDENLTEYFLNNVLFKLMYV